MNLPSIEIKCPECGMVSNIRGYDMQMGAGMDVALCDMRNGGCGNYFSFVLSVDVKVISVYKVRHHAHRIKGELAYKCTREESEDEI